MAVGFRWAGETHHLAVGRDQLAARRDRAGPEGGAVGDLELRPGGEGRPAEAAPAGDAAGRQGRAGEDGHFAPTDFVAM